MKTSKVCFAIGMRNWIMAIWTLELRSLRTRSVTGICSIGTGVYANAGAIDDAFDLADCPCGEDDSAMITFVESFGARAAGALPRWICDAEVLRVDVRRRLHARARE